MNQEMLGVLMTGARTGQRRPRLAESADLILGALRIRLRPRLDSSADPGWREALALFSVILPVFMLALTAASIALYLPQGVEFSQQAAGIGLVVQGQIVVAVLVLLRLRRTAGLVAVATLIWFTAIASTGPGVGIYSATVLASYFFSLSLETAALALSAGPRRGWQILTWKRFLVLIIAGVAAGAVVAGIRTRPGAPAQVIAAAAVAVLLIIATGMALASLTSRRVLVLLAVPAYSFAAAFLLSERPGSVAFAALAVTCLPPLAVLCLAVTTMCRSARHPGSLDGLGQ